MALNTLTSLEQEHGFLYTKKLLFGNVELEKKIKNSLLEKSISQEALHYGTLYEQELLHGYEAPSVLQWIHKDVGYGLYSTLDLPQGSFIGEYTGIIDVNAPYYKMKDYVFSYPLEDASQKKFSIDAESYGNLTRFINHSFQPNLTPLHAFHEGLYHVILVANRPIKQGEQLTYSYGHSYWYIRGTPMTF
jgi:hypothetical protein